MKVFKKKSSLTRRRQQELYNLLRDAEKNLPPDLWMRFREIRKFFGPAVSVGNAIAFFEFMEDAVVRWIEALSTDEEVEWPEFE